MARTQAEDLLSDPILTDGTDGDGEREARRALLEHLLDAGATRERLTAAAREERLATLPVELALRGEQRHTLTDVAKAARLDSRYLRSVLLSLGHPNPRRGERSFTDEDVEVARLLRRFLDAGLARDDVLAVCRVLGHSLSRIAAVLREVAGNALIEAGDSEHTLGLRYAAAAEEMVPQLSTVLDHELQFHLREQATRDVITRAERERGELAETREIAVCFVDLSHFTRLGDTLSPEQLARVGARVGELATHVAAPPVELVKTIGDGAMLVSPEVPPLLDALCDLVRHVDGEDDGFPALRGGVAFGPAVNRAADWFGPPVNRASRIVDVAKAGTVLAEDAVHDRAGERFEWSKRRLPTGLRGISGWSKLYRLHLPGADD